MKRPGRKVVGYRVKSAGGFYAVVERGRLRIVLSRLRATTFTTREGALDAQRKATLRGPSFRIVEVVRYEVRPEDARPWVQVLRDKHENAKVRKLAAALDRVLDGLEER